MSNFENTLKIRKPKLILQKQQDKLKKHNGIRELCAIIMGHLVILIIQLFFLVLYLLCKTLDLPGVAVTSLLSWTFPICFYIILTLVSLFKKQYGLSLVYFLFTLLIFSIPNKVWFVYHNIIIHFALISLFLLLLYKKKTQASLNKYFKIFVILIATINISLLFASDNFVLEKLGSNYLFKSYSDETLSWQHFNKVDSINGGYDAKIESYIAYKINRVYNFTSATAVAKTELENNHYVSQTDDLLEHELYHFKITELVTRKLNKALCNYHFSSYDNTQKIIYQYTDTLYAMQKAYDTETNHNLNTKKQRQWKVWVDQQLDK